MEIRGYMRFDRDFTYKGFQCKVGVEYEIIDNMKLFFYRNPLNLLRENAPIDDRYAVVIGSVLMHSCSSLFEMEKIRIEKEISLRELIEAGVKYAVDAANENMGTRLLVMTSGHGSIAASKHNWSLAFNTDSYSMAVNEGRHSMAITKRHCSAAVSRGDLSTAITKGHCSMAVCTNEGSSAIVEGFNSTAIALGRNAKARAKVIGSWLIFADWQHCDDDGKLHSVGLKTFYVDGKTVKEDTFYQYSDGRLVEVEEEEIFGCL